MRRLLLILFYILPFATACAQKENNNWAFGIGQGLSFNTTPPSVIATSIYTHMPNPCAVSDSLGNLLFYTDGERVWDRSHNQMPGGAGLIVGRTDPMCMQDSTDVMDVNIIPMPGNKFRYYIIGSVNNWVYDGVFSCEQYTDVKYCIVDMSLNGGMGDVVPGTKNTLLYSRVYGNIAAGEGRCNKWLLLTNSNSELVSFEISPFGISAPKVSSLGLPANSINELKISNDNSRLAVETNWLTGNVSLLHLYDFDLQTGSVTNKRFLDSAGINAKGGADWLAGFAFSHDNSKFYYWAQFGLAHEIFQMDLSKASHQAVLASKTKVYTVTKYLHSWDMMLAPDGKIYMAFRDNGDWLVINRPNRTGTACDIKVVKLPPPLKISTYSLIGFQNWIPSSGVHYSYSDFAECAAPLALSSKQSSADSYVWSTGAATKDITVTAAGTYWVKASESCGAYRVDTFHVNFNPVRPPADTFSCNGEPITIPMLPGAGYTWGSNGGPVITQTGMYTVKIDVLGCGSVNSSFRAIIYPPAGTSLLPDDTVVCNAAAKADINSHYEMGQYQWSNGSTNRGITVERPGKYWLTSNTPCGMFTDTTNVAYCKPNVKDISLSGSICQGRCVDVYATVENFPVSFNWGLPTGATLMNASSDLKTIRVCFDSLGNHMLTLDVGSLGGYSGPFSKKISVLPQPVALFNEVKLNGEYKKMLLLPTCGEAEKIIWYREGELICEHCKELEIEAKLWRSNYTCIIQNGECTDTCSYMVETKNIPTDVWLPTAFTPNGDGKNDLFRPLHDNPNIQIMSLSVFNRQGVRVYRSSDDGSTGWDGRYGTTPQGMGTYFWMLQYKVLGKAEIFTIKGDVTLVR